MNTAPSGLTTIKILGYLVFSLGLIAALLCLAAPAGVWVSAWDFRKGFALLRFVNSWALWLAYGSLALTGVIVVLAWRYKVRQGVFKAVSFAVMGTLLALVAWTIPETYRPAEDANVPPIHDITTNTDQPLEFVAVLPLRGERSNTTVYGGAPNMTPEKLAALQKAAYPNIKPQLYSAPAAEIFDRALAIAEVFGWEIVAADKASGRIEATDTTFWFRFKDDIVIHVAEKDGMTELNARSISRVGVSDVGKNAARLTAFFAAMEAQ